MVWCAARSLYLPAIEVRAVCTRAPVAAGIGCASVVGTSLWRSSSASFRSKPFACLGIATVPSMSFLMSIINLFLSVL